MRVLLILWLALLSLSHNPAQALTIDRGRERRLAI